jgi:Arc/MetJ-type ribon-helix-helix transcriptional regulator
MRSVRLDPELEARLERAASLLGESRSDFIRHAVTERIEATLAASPAQRVAHLLGAVDLGGQAADRVDEAVGTLVLREHLAQGAAWQRRP